MGVERTSGNDDRTENTESPPPQDDPPALPPDRPGSPGYPSRLESLRAAREPQHGERRANTSETSSTDPASETEDTPTPETIEGPSETGETEPREPVRDQPRTDEPPQRMDAPTFRAAWSPPADDGITRWSSPVLHVNERTPGAQVENRGTNTEGRQETQTTTNDETDNYRFLPNIPREGTPGRAELRRPEDDPEHQDLREPDPDRTTRGDRIRRQVGRSAEAASDVSTKVGNKIDKFLHDRPPDPLKISTARSPVPDMQPMPQNMKLGNGVIGVTLGMIVLVKAGQRAYGGAKDKAHEMLGRRDGSNG